LLYFVQKVVGVFVRFHVRRFTNIKDQYKEARRTYLKKNESLLQLSVFLVQKRRLRNGNALIFFKTIIANTMFYPLA
jgi:hypothetical protein